MTDTVDKSKRDFLYVSATAFTAVGAAFAAWPLIDQMNPDATVKALASVEVDLSDIELGQSITITWRGAPVFVRHRTEDEIAIASKVSLDQLPHPEADKDRVQKSEWLVMVGICTHLGCIPKGQKVGDEKGDFGGWFCPCHGSHYDTSGRIRKGPAPENLKVPPYKFIEDSLITIG